jgi:hypothetical protein
MLSKHDLIFQQWVASLSSRDRSRNAIQGNFEELFLSLRNEGLVLESAYDYLGRAIRAHEPNSSLIKNVFKKIRVKGTSHVSEKEFGEAWCKDIADKATAVFFDIFPVETKEEPEDAAVYGSMTAKEYRAQRKHADAYPRLDTSELEKRVLSDNYNPVADIAAMLGRNSGNLE